MEKKQTAVEWLESKLKAVKPSEFCSIETIIEWTQQAKEMEKEQIADAQSYAISNADMTNNRGYFDCEKYYKETYGK